MAAATIAAGGTVQQARDAAQDRLEIGLAIYGQPVLLTDLDCVGTLVQVSVVTSYAFQGAVLAAGNGRQTIEARGAAEAFLVLPGNQQSQLNHLTECPLDPAPTPDQPHPRAPRSRRPSSRSWYWRSCGWPAPRSSRRPTGRWPRPSSRGSIWRRCRAP